MLVLEIKHMKLVSSVVETGSLTNASKKLNLSQPALSLQLTDIESKLGVALFNRVGKKLILTKAGEIIYDTARKVLFEISDAEKRIGRISVGSAIYMKIASVCVLSYKWLPAVINQYLERFPSTEIEFSLTTDFISDLKENKLDMVIVRSTPQDPAIHYEPVFKDEMVAVMAPGAPLSHKSYLVLEDCEGIDLVTFSTPEKDDLNYQFLRPSGIKPARITKAEQPEMLIELVKSGFGVGVLPAWSVKEYVRAGTLCAKPLTKDGVFFTWYLAMRKERVTDDWIQWFVETVSQWGIV